MRKQVIQALHMNQVKRLLAASALSFTGLSAIAQAEQNNIQLNGLVDNLCEVTSTFTGLTSKVLDGLTENGKITDSENWIALGDVSCNYGTTLSLKTQNGGLKRAGGPITVPPGFTDRIPYTANAMWGSVNLSLSADGTADEVAFQTVELAISDELTIQILTEEDLTKTVVGGNYIDILTVKVGTPL